MPTFDKRGASIDYLTKAAWESFAGLNAQSLQRFW